MGVRDLVCSLRPSDCDFRGFANSWLSLDTKGSKSEIIWCCCPGTCNRRVIPPLLRRWPDGAGSGLLLPASVCRAAMDEQKGREGEKGRGGRGREIGRGKGEMKGGGGVTDT